MCEKAREITRHIKEKKDWVRTKPKKVYVSERGRGRVHREEGKPFKTDRQTHTHIKELVRGGMRAEKKQWL